MMKLEALEWRGPGTTGIATLRPWRGVGRADGRSVHDPSPPGGVEPAGVLEVVISEEVAEKWRSRLGEHFVVTVNPFEEDQ